MVVVSVALSVVSLTTVKPSATGRGGRVANVNDRRPPEFSEVVSSELTVLNQTTTVPRGMPRPTRSAVHDQLSPAPGASATHSVCSSPPARAQKLTWWIEVDGAVAVSVSSEELIVERLAGATHAVMTSAGTID